MDKLDKLVMKVSTWRRSDGKTYWRNPDTKEIEEYKPKGEKDVKPEDKDVDQPEDQPEDQPQDKESQQLDKIRSGEMDEQIEAMSDDEEEDEEYDDAFKQEAVESLRDSLLDETKEDLIEKHLDQIFDNPELRDIISQQINDTVGEDITSGMDDAQFGEYVYDMLSDFEDEDELVELIIDNMPKEQLQMWYDEYKEMMGDEEADMMKGEEKYRKVDPEDPQREISEMLNTLTDEQIDGFIQKMGYDPNDDITTNIENILGNEDEGDIKEAIMSFSKEDTYDDQDYADELHNMSVDDVLGTIDDPDDNASHAVMDDWIDLRVGYLQERGVDISSFEESGDMEELEDLYRANFLGDGTEPSADKNITDKHKPKLPDKKVKKDAKSDWISKKIGILRDEGYEEDQASAIAYSMYEEAHKSLDERIDNLYKKIVGE